MAGFTEFSRSVNDAQNFYEKVRDNLLGVGGSTNWYIAFGTEVNTASVIKKILIPTPAVDAYLNTDPTQTYRLLLYVTKSGINYVSFRIYFGDANQIAYNATNDDIIVNPSTPYIELYNGTYKPTSTTPYSYQMTITDRGWAMALWANARSNSRDNNVVFTIQRPVNPQTGIAKVSGAAPIMAFWRDINNSANNFQWAIVRDKEITNSYNYGTTSEVSRYNMYKITMDWSHPNVFDNTSHVVKFPYGFATTRHLYLDELDLICIVSSASYSANQDIKITMYGEADERKYKATYGSIQYGGLSWYNGYPSIIPNIIASARIGILYENGGVDPTP